MWKSTYSSRFRHFHRYSHVYRHSVPRWGYKTCHFCTGTGLDRTLVLAKHCQCRERLKSGAPRHHFKCLFSCQQNGHWKTVSVTRFSIQIIDQRRSWKEIPSNSQNKSSRGVAVILATHRWLINKPKKKKNHRQVGTATWHYLAVTVVAGTYSRQRNRDSLPCHCIRAKHHPGTFRHHIESLGKRSAGLLFMYIMHHAVIKY